MASNTTLQRRSQRAAEDSAAFGPVAERFRRAGDLDRAVSLCREGLQKFPHHISARVTLGWSLLDQGKYDEARVELEQVLRRAPDNLAAIRGLAELHDRAEHTLSLPMDGPGQWPPTEDAVNEAAATDYEPQLIHTPSPEEFASTADFVGDVAINEPEPPAQTMAVFTADEMIARATEVEPFEVGGDAPAAEAVAEVALEAEATVEVEPEPFVAQAEAAVDEEPIAAHAAAAVEESAPEADAVSEADIAALIAEAEKLDAAAAVHEGGVEVEATGEIDLEASGDIELGSAIETAHAAIEQPQAAIEELQAAVEEQRAIAEPEAAIEEPQAVIAASEEIEAVAAVAEAVEEFEAPAAEALAEPVAVEPVATEPVAAEPVADAPAEVAVFAQPEPAAEVVAEPEHSEVESDAEVHVDAVAAMAAVKHVHMAESVPMARAARVDPNQPTILALERFLSKVQARRRQVLSQSVA